jgi:hypothetical protein
VIAGGCRCGAVRYTLAVDARFTNPSGSTSRQFVCGTCHTRIYNSNSARPGLAMVRAGTLDESDRIEPRAAYLGEAQAALDRDPRRRIPQFDESAPRPREFMRDPAGLWILWRLWDVSLAAVARIAKAEPLVPRIANIIVPAKYLGIWRLRDR